MNRFTIALAAGLALATVGVLPTVAAASPPSAVGAVTAQVADGISVILEWAPPLSTGGAPIDHYNVYKTGLTGWILAGQPIQPRFVDNPVLVVGLWVVSAYKISATNSEGYEGADRLVLVGASPMAENCDAFVVDLTDPTHPTYSINGQCLIDEISMNIPEGPVRDLIRTTLLLAWTTIRDIKVSEG